MQDESLDKILRDAADQYHPAYNEKAWEGMHASLDKHLPQEKDRKKWLWLLIPLLATFIAGGVSWLNSDKESDAVAEDAGANATAKRQSLPTPAPVTAPAQANNSTAAQTRITDTSAATISTATTPATTASLGYSPANSNASNNITNTRGRAKMLVNPGNAVVDVLNDLERSTAPAKAKATITTAKPEVSAEQMATEQPAARKAAPLFSPTPDTASERQNTATVKKNAPTQSEKQLQNITKTTSTSKTTTAITTAEPETVAEQSATEQPAAKKAAPLFSPKPDTASEKQKTTTVKQPIPAQNEKQPKDTTKTTGTSKADKKRSGFGNHFAFTLSAGPDYSFVKTSYPGKIQTAYGIGIAYVFAKNFTVRAGVFAAKKIYSSDSASYKPTVPLSSYSGRLERIDGDCFVYEVPLLLSYDFAGKGRHRWFGSTGISSFFMKRETYTYRYRRNGIASSRAYTINNENNHLFSIVTLSGGYRYQLSKRVSFVAEPYFKLPLTGVGWGMLKLNSTGLLFSAVVRPFGNQK
jgi:hypothetical protein